MAKERSFRFESCDLAISAIREAEKKNRFRYISMSLQPGKSTVVFKPRIASDAKKILSFLRKYVKTHSD